MKNVMRVRTFSVHKELPWWHRVVAAAIGILLLLIPVVSGALAHLLLSGT